MSVRLRPLTRDELRDLDERAERDYGLSTRMLMENAGRGAAGWLAELSGATAGPIDRRLTDAPSDFTISPATAPDRIPRILLLCGPGNNGGDGGVVARHLDSWGFPVQVVWLARTDQLRGDPAVQASILDHSGIEQTFWGDAEDPDFLRLQALETRVARADWLVDALFGTGLSRPVEGTGRALIDLVNQSGKPILALDLPSGLDADTGRPLGSAVRALATATFAAPKIGFSQPGAFEYTGRIAVIDLGLPRRLIAPYQIP